MFTTQYRSYSYSSVLDMCVSKANMHVEMMSSNCWSPFLLDKNGVVVTTMTRNVVSTLDVVDWCVWIYNTACRRWDHRSQTTMAGFPKEKWTGQILCGGSYYIQKEE